jgi:hypothetical protein
MELLKKMHADSSAAPPQPPVTVYMYLYVYIYMYMYIHIYMYIYMCMYIYICIYIYTHNTIKLSIFDNDLSINDFD